MRIKVDFMSDKPLRIPLQNKEVIQGLFYKYMEPKTATFLHDEGFVGPTGRRFKMWNFSNIMAKLVRDTRSESFVVPQKFSIVVTGNENVMSDLASNLLNKQYITINNQSLEVDGVSSYDYCFPATDTVMIKTLSPITEYSTPVLEDGTKITHYYCPMEPRFAELIYKNLLSKYYIMYGKEAPNHEFSLKVAGRCREHIMSFKDTIVKAWSGKFELKAHPELIKVALECGLGAKSSQGFGCIDIVSVQ